MNCLRACMLPWAAIAEKGTVPFTRSFCEFVADLPRPRKIVLALCVPFAGAASILR
jgi:hypothetical protein